eukprot:TRINITY_DN454_c0_g2_i3.p1 TRINITY_DN454_c0_g2~~TRINITY_DN454_c0_g2_i3.p1  ORF type:complete len:250 (+),score=39.26 TRINITY_DN454_c0_g2_i3:469-1218(+)
MDILEEIEVPLRDEKGPVRIPVLDKLKDRGLDIFGKLLSGRIEVGTKLVIMPYEIPVEIASIQNMEDDYVSYAKSGENIKFKLKGTASDDDISKGNILCSPDNLCAVFQVFIAEVKVLNLLKHKPIISIGYQCILHLHTFAEECTITKLIGVKGPTDTDFHPSKCGRENDIIQCLIESKIPIAAEKYSVRRMLGRFTLRDEGKTIAIGTIQKYQPMKSLTSKAPAPQTSLSLASLSEKKKKKKKKKNKR